MDKVAIIRTDRLGDMVLTLPMARAIKECNPNAKIAMIASSYTEPLLYNNAYLDNYYFIDKIPLNEIFQQNNFDIAFFPRPKFNEALEAFKNKIPIRIGSAYRWYSFLFNHKLNIHRKKGDLHEAEYNTLMVAKFYNRIVSTELIAPFIKIEADQKILGLFEQYQINSNSKIIIIHPGSKGSAKDWHPKNFAKAARILKESLECEILITGTQEEKESCNIILKECPSAFTFCGLLNLDELIALISHSNLLIANSTGVLHLASALGIAVLGLYPNTKHIGAGRWGPYSRNSLVISPPITDNKKAIDDMSLIEVETVVNSALKLLGIRF